jgi:hypothetical protein
MAAMPAEARSDASAGAHSSAPLSPGSARLPHPQLASRTPARPRANDARAVTTWTRRLFCAILPASKHHAAPILRPTTLV